MADIHIGKINETTLGRGQAELYYHIPISSPKAGIIPTPVSAISSQLDSVEIAALAAGTVVEDAKTIIVGQNQTQQEIIAAIKNDWQNIKTEYNRKYDFEYKFFGVKLNATT